MFIKGVYWKTNCTNLKCEFTDNRVFYGSGNSACGTCNGEGYLIEKVVVEKPNPRDYCFVDDLEPKMRERGYYDKLEEYNTQLSILKEIEEALEVEPPNKKYYKEGTKESEEAKKKIEKCNQAQDLLKSYTYTNGHLEKC